ncbi:PAP2 superfamily protein [Trichomonas vaginalis G3]|uniref:PAP2 superfamily protein n=1 Tax=Trichomonas vaginalis (strain ATCC PRA-98 / G3) TaxID=412133 RepID=A2EKG7_TRIV3|nr:phosphatidate phosphatase protein [Trichomonas vaginalis G3]EAY06875.1 PAP2 superfamily protein [Trichomonas vaginalis G3]KAI5489181.1 phosphatidate phosphatase protein [Trichomonas vaginalis G3]|eukprot:XP_001319098.1 PAP2 superfamily protein [Trichomonas vaginalis G3]
MIEIDERDPLWKRILYFIDYQDMIISILALAVWLGLSTIEPNYLYIPENDGDSNYPMKKSQIPFLLLSFIVFGGFNLIFIGLYFLARRYPKYFCRFDLFPVAWGLVFAISMSNIFVNVPKSYVGRARPDIYARCGVKNLTECPQKILKEEHKSWPSGHSSTAMSATIYMAAFFIKFLYAKPYAIIFSALFALFGIYVGATRIVDFRHHPDDVLAGLFIGFIAAYIVWENLSTKIFIESNQKDETLPLPQTITQ